VLLARFRGRRGQQTAGGTPDAHAAGPPPAMRTSPDEATPGAAAPGQATPTR
jgi:hypothetical protein